MAWKKNFWLFTVLIILVVLLQFILPSKHLLYGFHIDDWGVLAWYKQTISNPITDIPKAWKIFTPHVFIHAYYMGILFELFKFDYVYYYAVNIILKSLAVLSFFPLVYLLFRNKLLAFLTTILFAINVSPFGVIYHVIGGEDSLMILGLNLSFAFYIYLAQNKLLKNIKLLIILLIFFLISCFIDITRSYPLLLLVPFLELLNLTINKSSTSLKAIFIRLFVFYSPFIALLLYSRSYIHELNFNKFIPITNGGNYQLSLSLFASFASTFVPKDLFNYFGGANYQNLERFISSTLFTFSFIFFWVFLIMGYLVNIKALRFALRTLAIGIFFSLVAFYVANHSLYIDPKVRLVDPISFFIPSLIGLFIFSSAISFFIEWFGKKEDKLLFAASIAPIFSLLYTFLTWILVDYSSIYMGVHAYLNVPALGVSIYFAIFLYSACRKLISSKSSFFGRLATLITLVYFFVYLISSAHQIDEFFSYNLINGMDAKDQQRIQNSFWKEVKKTKYDGKNPTLIYYDGSQDYINGTFYSTAFIWNIQPLLAIEKGEPYDLGAPCRSEISADQIDKIRIELVNGEKMIVQNSCGYDIFYKMENFYAFKMVNRDLVPITSEVLAKLQSK